MTESLIGHIFKMTFYGPIAVNKANSKRLQRDQLGAAFSKTIFNGPYYGTLWLDATVRELPSECSHNGNAISQLGFLMCWLAEDCSVFICE